MLRKLKKIKQTLLTKFTHEQWLIIGLTITVTVILLLGAALAWRLNWSPLAICTLIFLLSYPLIWIAWRCYHFWCQLVMQLTTYTQVIKEGETTLQFKRQNQDNLLCDLQQEIASLAMLNQVDKQNSHTLENLISHILDAWPIPVCLFDEQYQLTYRNAAMNDKIQQPMLLGASVFDLGFTLVNDNFYHVKFDNHWQCQSVSYLHQNKKCWLFSALNISQNLHQHKNITQQNLIRVLAHELRNSLTPMSSMADTLLTNELTIEQKISQGDSSSNKQLNPQVTLVLTRIRQRSDRLLNFIEQYSQLTQLPPPKCTWFNINEIIDEAKSMIKDGCSITLQGNEQCFGDVGQMSQILINLFKNAQESCEAEHCLINISIFYRQQEQVIEITDNGPGFSNLNNVLTPFYTTKTHGSGIGLSLCAEITRNHGGEFTVENIENSGAKIIMTWPIE